MSNKTLLIFKHEFYHLLRKKGFIVMTLIVPIIALVAIEGYHIASGIRQAPAAVKETKIGYVDESGGFSGYTSQGSIKLIPYGTADAAKKALIGDDISEYIVIPGNYIQTGIVSRYTMERQMIAPENVSAAIQDFLMSNMLADKVATSVIARVKAPMYLATVVLTKTGTVAPSQGGVGNFIVLAAFSILFALSMVFSSSYMIQGLGKEKENRLMEILLSSVSPRQLLTGKLLGFASAGLVQAGVWAASVPFLLMLAKATIGNFTNVIQLPLSFFFIDIAYFILGYMLFGVLASGIGAISATSQEGQQLASIYTIFALIPLWTMSLIAAFPNNPIWAAMTIFPFTSPVLVVVRLGVGNVPVWQLIVSLAVLVLSIIGGLFLSTRAFEAYLLMYGKRPKLREFLRNMRRD